MAGRSCDMEASKPLIYINKIPLKLRAHHSESHNLQERADATAQLSSYGQLNAQVGLSWKPKGGTGLFQLLVPHSKSGAGGRELRLLLITPW